MLISRKIGLLVAIAMCTCAAVSSFGLHGLKLVNSDVTEIADRSVPAVLLTSDLRTTYLALIPQAYNRATTIDPEKGAALDKQVDEGNRQLIKQLNEYTARTTDEEEKKMLDEAKRGMLSFIAKMRQVGLLANAGNPQMALDVIQRDIGPLHQRLSTAFGQWTKPLAR